MTTKVKRPSIKFLAAVERTKGMSIESAALTVACRAPRLANAVLEEVGAWPSSDPAIRALQRFWNPR